MKQLRKIDILFLVILILLTINHKFNIKIYNKKNISKSVLNLNQSKLFELCELYIMIYLILYCVSHFDFVNLYIFLSAYIQHILQIVYCYRYTNKNKKLSTMTIYMVLIIYNIITNKQPFIFLWSFAFLIHYISYYNKMPFMKVICLSNYIFI